MLHFFAVLCCALKPRKLAADLPRWSGGTSEYDDAIVDDARFGRIDENKRVEMRFDIAGKYELNYF